MITPGNGWLARFDDPVTGEPAALHLPVVVWRLDESGGVCGLILNADGALVDAWARVGFAGFVFDAQAWQEIANLGEPFAPPWDQGA